MMDELPAIIHKLSLRLWCLDDSTTQDQELVESTQDDVAIDPLASPPLDAVDAQGNVLDANEISNLSLDGGTEIHSLFSQKNLLRLATLTNSHRTLSLFTPSIRDAVFRACAGPCERGESVGTSTPATPSLVRSHSAIGSTSTTYTFSSRSSEDGGSISSRPSMVRLNTETTGLGLGAGRHSRNHGHRKRKNRVINLRSKSVTDDTSVSGDSDVSSLVGSSHPPSSEVSGEPEDVIPSPPRTPRPLTERVRFQDGQDLDITPRPLRAGLEEASRKLSTPELKIPAVSTNEGPQSAPVYNRSRRPTLDRTLFPSFQPEKTTDAPAHLSAPFTHRQATIDSPTSILEHAWMAKMAEEMTRRAYDAKASRDQWPGSQITDAHDTRADSPPPAYEPMLGHGAYQTN